MSIYKKKLLCSNYKYKEYSITANVVTAYWETLASLEFGESPFDKRNIAEMPKTGAYI